MNWYYEQAGQRQGPVSDSELDALIAAGTVTATTVVWHEGMADWAALKDARPGGVAAESIPADWVRCTATGKFFPPSQIVYLDGKPYSADAKPGVLQGVMQGGMLPTGTEMERVGPAWENRAQLGIVKAAWETMKGALTKPDETFSRMNRTGGIGGPYLYFVIAGALSMLVTLALVMIFLMPFVLSAINTAQQSRGGPTVAAAGGIGVAIFVVYGVLLLSSIAIMPFINAGIIHLCLMMVGGARHPFETTFRAWCYAQGSGMFLMLIPVCGWMAAGIWALVITCIGLARAHEISTGKAVLAVLLPAGVCCLLQVGLQVVVGMAQNAPH